MIGWRLNFVFTTVFFVFLIFACQEEEIPIIDSELRAISPKEQVLNIGQSPILQVQYYDQTGKINTQRAITWVSSNPLVISVDAQSGKLTPLKPGTAVITASVITHYGAILKQEFTASVLIEGFLNISSTGDLPVLIGAPIPTILSFQLVDQINTKLTPSKIIWNVDSTEEPILSINENGVIQPLKPGTTKVYLTVTHENKDYQSSIEVEVIQEPSLEIINPNTEIKIESKGIEPLRVQYINKKGQSIDTNTSTIRWESSDQEILIIDSQTGQLNPIKPGTVIVKVIFEIDEEQYSKEIEIEVLQEPVLEIINSNSAVKIGNKDLIPLSIEFINQKGQNIDPNNGKILWESRHREILEIVSDHGHLNPIKPGIAVIRVVFELDGVPYSEEIEIEIIQEPSLEIINTNTEIKIENQNLNPLKVQYIDAMGQVIDASVGRIQWKSNDQEILEIEQTTGKLMPQKVGIVTVSVTFDFKGKQYKDQIEIEISQQAVVVVPSIAHHLRIDGSKPMQIGDFEFTNEKGFEEIPDSFCWKSSNTEVLIIDCQGNFTLNKPGSVYLTLIISDDGKDYMRKTQEIIVEQNPVIHFEFPNETPIEVIRTTQGPIQLGYRFIDEKGNTVTLEAVEWESSNSEALEIDSSGMMTPLKPDQVKITVSAYQNGMLLAQNEWAMIVKQESKVEIVNPPNEISTLQTDPIQLQIKYTDEDGNRRVPSNIIWTSDDEDKLKIDKDGILTVVHEGEVTITVQIGNQGPVASHTILVKMEVEPELELTQSSQTLLQGKSIPLYFTYRDQTGQPSSPQPHGTWSIGNSNVVSFNEKLNLLTAISPGRTTISVTVQGLTEQISILVEVEPELTITSPNIPLQLNRDTHDLNPIFTDQFSSNRTNSQIISYENYDTDVVIINHQGQISPVSAGSTSVVVKTVFKGQVYQQSSLIEVISFTIQDIPDLKVGQADHTLGVRFTNEKATTSNPTVSWSSDFFEFIGGKLKVNKPGKDKRINARFNYKGADYTTTITTSVMTDITFGMDSFNQNIIIPQNGTANQPLSATLRNEYGEIVSESEYKITWTSDDKSVANINNGILSPLSKGTANISAQAIYNNQNIQATSVAITIVQPTLRLNEITEGILVGEDVLLGYSFTNGDDGGSDLTPKSIGWTKANSSGIFRANAVGTYQVKLSATYGGLTFEDSLEIKVRELTITGKPSNDEVILGGSSPSLTFNFKNEQDIFTNADSYSWRLKDSNKSSILTVDPSTGQIIPKSKGTATIILKVTYDNHVFEIEYEITIKPPPPVNIDLESSTYERSDFVWKALNHYYLWQGDVPNLADSKANPEDDYKRFIKQNSNHSRFFSDLLYKRGQRGGDLYSYSTTVSNIASVHSAARFDNGLLFQLLRYSSNSSNLVGVVQFAFPGTPADGKVSRGDFFSHVNGTRLTLSNYHRLLNANTLSLKMVDLRLSVDLDNPVEVVDLNRTVSISKQLRVIRNPIMAHSIISKGSKKIGYLAYYQFHQEVSGLNTVFKTFADEPITDLILDLRYNGGGYLSTAVALASMISGQSSSSVFIQSKYNSNINGGSQKQYFIDYLDSSKTVPVNKLNVSNVYVLTSSRTASASEVVISGISPYVNVTVIGEQTVGKHLATLYLFDHNDSPRNYHRISGDLNTDHNFVLNVVISSVTNSSGESYGYDGFTPSSFNKIKENLVELKPLGDAEDLLVKRALNLITGVSSRRAIEGQNYQVISIEEPHEGGLIKTFDESLFPKE